MITSIGRIKAYNEFQHLFMIQTLSKPGINRNFLKV